MICKKNAGVTVLLSFLIGMKCLMNPLQHEFGSEDEYIRVPSGYHNITSIVKDSAGSIFAANYDSLFIVTRKNDTVNVRYLKKCDAGVELFRDGKGAVILRDGNNVYKVCYNADTCFFDTIYRFQSMKNYGINTVDVLGDIWFLDASLSDILLIKWDGSDCTITQLRGRQFNSYSLFSAKLIPGYDGAFLVYIDTAGIYRCDLADGTGNDWYDLSRFNYCNSSIINGCIIERQMYLLVYINDTMNFNYSDLKSSYFGDDVVNQTVLLQIAEKKDNYPSSWEKIVYRAGFDDDLYTMKSIVTNAHEAFFYSSDFLINLNEMTVKGKKLFSQCNGIFQDGTDNDSVFLFDEKAMKLVKLQELPGFIGEYR